MSDIVKMILGFTAILFVGLASVTVLKMMKAGTAKATISTVDNAASVR